MSCILCSQNADGGTLGLKHPHKKVVLYPFSITPEDFDEYQEVLKELEEQGYEHVSLCRNNHLCIE